MAKSDVVTQETGALARITRASSPAERRRHAADAFRMVDDDSFPGPVPAFFLDLPRDAEDDDVSWRIAAQVAAGETPLHGGKVPETVRFSDLVGHDVTVETIRMRPSDGTTRVGAFAVMEITIDDDMTPQIVFSSSPHIVGPVALAWAAGMLPIRGLIVEAMPATGAKAASLAFVAREPMVTEG